MARTQATQEKEMSFLDHLEVLRWHLMRSVLAVLVLAVAAFIYKDIIFDHIIFAPKDPDFLTNRLFCKAGGWLNILLEPLGMAIDPAMLCINQNQVELYNINLSGQFTTHVQISLLAGVIAAFPYVFYELWRFIRPALYDKEARHSRGAIFYTTGLFAMGVLFGYYLVMPLTVHFFTGYQISSQVANEINLSSYISSFSSVVFSSGVVFELPVLIYFFSKIGLVSSAFLKRYRKHAIIILLTVSAIITPPDVFSQILVGLPLWLLYEASITIAKRVERKKALESI